MNSYNEFEAKPHFEYLVKEYLSPLLKEKGYKKKGGCWTKTNGEIEANISLKKSTYNTKRGINFCFCISVLKRDEGLGIGDQQNDLFLPRKRVEYKWENHHWNGWYLIYRASEFEKLLNEELKVDIEEYIIPLLEKINTTEKLRSIIFKKEEIEKHNKGQRWYIPDEVSLD